MAAVFAGLAASLTVATPANAAAQECPARYICLYEHHNLEGDSHLIVDQAALIDTLVTRGFDNKTSSIYNRTAAEWCLYEHPYYMGRLIGVIWPGEASNLGAVNDNVLSSLRICP